MLCVRAFLVGMVCVFLSACTPLLTSYPEGVQDHLRSIKVDTIPNRTGQHFRLKLLKMLGSEDCDVPTRYRLSVSLTRGSQVIGIGKDATSQRIRFTISATYTLKGTCGKTLKTGTLKSYGSYNYILGAFYTNTVSSEAVEFQVLDTLSSLLFLELADSFLTSSTQDGVALKVSRAS